MNKQATSANLKSLSTKQLTALKRMIESELDSRGTFMSNTTHTPHEQAQSLSTFFANAWIH